MSNGPFNVSAEIEGLPRGRVVTNCVTAVIDNTPPALTLKDANGNFFTYATSMTPLTVQGNDTVSGIEKITLLKPDQTTSAQTSSGVLTSTSATFSGLAEGQYTALIYDLAGNRSTEGNINSPYLLSSVQEHNHCSSEHPFEVRSH